MWLDCLNVTGCQRRGPSIKRRAGGRQADAVEHGLPYRQSAILRIGELRQVTDRHKASDDARVGCFAAGEDS